MGEQRFSWSDYARHSDALAAELIATGLAPGARVAVLLPDGPGVHVAFLATEKAGLVAMGIGPRAGEAELRHLLERSGAGALVSTAHHRGLDLRAWTAALPASSPLRHHLVVADEAPLTGALATARAMRPDPSRRLGATDLFLLNSTSGTTGLPKCVTHDQARWNHFHRLAVDAGALSPSDVFLSALPAPFGFGLWTAHFTPTLLGAPTVLIPEFDAERLLEELQRHAVSVLAAVSTQFILLLDALGERPLPSLRVLFTGGEAVPYARAADFEERTGARVLQFYGSNETGALSRTTLSDDREVRLRTAGHVIDEMQVRLFDETGRDVTAEGRGQAGCRGPLTSQGYYDDDDANAKLTQRDGWMLTGDTCEIDGAGVLRVVGRTADIIIRGGKNISAAVVEAAVASHPAVALAAAVPVPDPVFGERVCAVVELLPEQALDLERLVAHLREAGISVESWPEHLWVVDELPRSSGGKIAKGALRSQAPAALGLEERS